jgi:hypothetical protein
MKRTLFAIVLALALSGCTTDNGEGVASVSGTGAAQQSANPSQPAADPEERVRQFVACLRDQGLDVPDPDPGDENGKSVLRFDDAGIDKATFNAAMEKCQQYLPQGEENHQMTPEEIELQRAFAQCMRNNGYPQFPDPDPQDGQFKNLEIDKNDTNVRATVDKCRGEHPSSPGAKK